MSVFPEKYLILLKLIRVFRGASPIVYQRALKFIRVPDNFRLKTHLLRGFHMPCYKCSHGYTSIFYLHLS